MSDAGPKRSTAQPLAACWSSNPPHRACRAGRSAKTRRHNFAAKEPGLAARKIVRMRCLQFAARGVIRVNVRALQESQSMAKWLARRGFSRQTRPGFTCAGRLHDRKPLKRHGYCKIKSRLVLVIRHKGFQGRAFPPEPHAAERQTPPVALSSPNAPELCRKTTPRSALSRPCPSSISASVGFRFVSIPSPRFRRKRHALTLRYQHST